jgi:FeS assembly SUF system protein
MIDKNLSDFLPDKNVSYFKEFIVSDLKKNITEQQVVEELKKVMDPEIPVNLYDLGLIYKINIDNLNNVLIDMTLTNPNCPVAGSMPEGVGKAVEKLSYLSSVKVSLVWQPKWHKDMMSEDAKLALDIF